MKWCAIIQICEFFTAMGIEASEDQWRALRASTDRLPVDCRRPRGRPRQSWLRTIESDLKPLNLGLHSALRQASDRPTWRRIVETAMVFERATWWWSWWWIDKDVHTDDTCSALETFNGSGLYKFTFYIYIYIDMELDISWRKLVFMDRKLLSASAGCRRYSRYVHSNYCDLLQLFCAMLWKQDFCSLTIIVMEQKPCLHKWWWESNPCHKVRVRFGSLQSADHVEFVRFGSCSPKIGSSLVCSVRVRFNSNLYLVGLQLAERFDQNSTTVVYGKAEKCTDVDVHFHFLSQGSSQIVGLKKTIKNVKNVKVMTCKVLETSQLVFVL